ncbi:MAG: alcohol dehydrogenase [Planctomycetes bacterium]|nr:alcohol dehydrogenase [Planctomycetota bacterium]
MCSPVLCVLIVLGIAGPSAFAADWPCYRGPNHNGISQETDWSANWGTSGPKVLWQKSIGIGFSTTAVADGRVYNMGNSDKKTDIVYCFDAKTGQELWKHTYPSPLEPKYYDGGTLSTPTVAGGKVYTLGKMGDFFCLDAKTGKVLWQKQLNKELGFELPTWHFSSSTLIVDDKAILNIGTGGLALHKDTGAVVWQSDKGKCGYATPVPFTMDGRPGLALFGEVTLVAVSPTDGKRLWEYPWRTQYEVNAADPIVVGNQVFLTTGYKRGCGLIEVHGADVKKIWENRVMAMQINSPVLHEGHVYGFDENVFKCLKLQDGSEQWADRSLGKGALMMSADGRLIITSERGELVIAKADPQKFDVLARAQILTKTRCWTSPVLANGRIYARNAAGDFVCVDVSGK